MKFKTSATTAIGLFTFAFLGAVALSGELAAQDSKGDKPKHHHYKLIDVGTFGGPNFFANFTGYNNRLLNNQGTLVGGAFSAFLKLPAFARQD